MSELMKWWNGQWCMGMVWSTMIQLVPEWYWVVCVLLRHFLCLLSWSEMEETEDPVQKPVRKTLLIRHLPAELSQDEKEDLLKYFGAESVRVFATTGRLVSCASLTPFIWVASHSEQIFPLLRNIQPLQPSEVRGQLKRWVFSTCSALSDTDLRTETIRLYLSLLYGLFKALTRLHQLEILDHKLVVEFAKCQDPVTVLKDPPVSDRYVTWVMNLHWFSSISTHQGMSCTHDRA